MRWSRGGNLGLAATVPPSHSHHFKLTAMKIQNESIFKSVCIIYIAYHSLQENNLHPTVKLQVQISTRSYIIKLEPYLLLLYLFGGARCTAIQK